MKLRITLALSLTIIFFAACNEKDIDDRIPSKYITKVYDSAVLVSEMHNTETNTWDTLLRQTRERRLTMEFFWTGDRLDSIVNGEELSRFVYNDNDHVVRIEGGHGNSMLLSYNSNGQLDSCKHYNTAKGEETPLAALTTYTYSRGVLQKMKHAVLTADEKSNEQTVYRWTENNITRAVRYSESHNGTRDTQTFDFTMSKLDNPFCGIAWFMLPGQGLLPAHVGTDGFSNNRVASYKQGAAQYTIEYTDNGQRLVAAKETMKTETPNRRMVLVTRYEFEY